MVSFPTPQQYVFNNFKGIRTRNGIAQNGTISATVCQNVDFAPSSYDAGVDIRTTLGNAKISSYDSENDLYAYVYIHKTETGEEVEEIIYTKGTSEITSGTDLYEADGEETTNPLWAVAEVDDTYVIQYDGHTAEYDRHKDIYEFTVIKGFEFETKNGKKLLFYVENGEKGQLVNLVNSTSTTVIIDDLTVTGEANGITMIDNAYNTFVFTNGVDYYAWCPDTDTPANVLRQLTPQYDSNDVTGLALAEQDGSLVIGCDNGIVLASAKGDITDWDYNATQSDTKAWYQLFGKKITAVIPYIDALLVFTEEDSTVLSGNFSNPAKATRQDASLGGCMSYESWCKHDKYLFFYDNRQKNIYYYMQNNYGQKVLGEPVAPEVQKFFNNVTRLQMTSYVGNNRSEIWLLSDNFRLIFDYYVGEWGERNCQDLTSYFVYNNEVLSTGSKKIFREKVGNMCMFDGDYYPAKYTMQIINLGSFSNAKEMDIYPLLSVSQSFNNTFYLECLVDGKKTKKKDIKMFFQGAIWAEGDTDADLEPDEDTPENELWAEGNDMGDMNAIGQVFPDENSSLIQQIKGKIIPFWYYLQFTVGTTQRGDDFSISCFELKGITQEYDTIGRK